MISDTAGCAKTGRHTKHMSDGRPGPGRSDAYGQWKKQGTIVSPLEDNRADFAKILMDNKFQTSVDYESPFDLQFPGDQSGGYMISRFSIMNFHQNLCTTQPVVFQWSASRARTFEKFRGYSEAK